ncbi:hypothetical protein [uncultured Planktosalinus sp.]|uniref:glycosyltransferase family protein n=1 Tax=uncultured Planktosalinus sp. TaxID=1810935 RepID=UPI0030D796AA
MSIKFPKILIISHNALSESSANGRTLASLVSSWNTEKISQFYVNNELPDFKYCFNYFRISDSDLIKNFLFNKHYVGEIKNENIKAKYSDLKDRKNWNYSKLKKYFSSFLYLAREGLWDSKWNNKNLLNWIDSIEPDIVLLQPGDYAFLYKMTLWVSDFKEIPYIIYNSEDYFLKKRNTISPLYHIYSLYYKKIVKNCFKNASHIIYSNDFLMENMTKQIQRPSSVILTSSNLEKSIASKSKSKLKISYTGNLGHERWKSLIEIGKALKTIDSSLEIEVYSGFLPQEAKKHFITENGINFCGAVSYEKVKEVIQESDIVLHVEGFSEFTKWDIKHGFSTKIADLLSSGKCFLMYGPKEIACVDYLIKNQAAWVATNKDELKEVLNKLVGSEEARKKFLDNAEELVEERHNKEKNAQKFEEIIRSVCKVSKSTENESITN